MIYTVKIQVKSNLYVEVEAESEKQAIEKANREIVPIFKKQEAAQLIKEADLKLKHRRVYTCF